MGTVLEATAVIAFSPVPPSVAGCTGESGAGVVVPGSTSGGVLAGT